MKDISIIVPIYNVSKFIKKCAISLFEQTYHNIEFIFVDDCTKDNSIEILIETINGYPDRKDAVKIIKHEKNRGLAAARNTGLFHAEGEYILNVDSDDYIDRDAVQLLLEKAKSESADIVICDILIEWEKTQKIAFQIFKDKESYLKQLLNSESMPGIVNKMVRRELYINNDIFPKEGIDLGEDYMTTPRLVYKAKKIAKVDKGLYHYIQYNTNSYTKKMSLKAQKDLEFVLLFLNEYFKSTPIYDDVKFDLLKGQLIKKLDAVTRISKNERKSMFEKFPESNRVFAEISLTLKERITFYLCNKNYYLLLNLFINIYGVSFEFLQILKGRR